MNNKDLMVDIETMGNKSNSSIVSIGAVAFDMNTGETGSQFYKTVSLQSCLDIGLTVNGDTIMWWLEQSNAARMELTNTKPIPITDALEHFKDFIIEDVGSDSQFWGNSARFDLGILENAFNKCGIKIPWLFWNERDVRTLVSFNPKIKENYVHDGVDHTPISDCLKQIGYCTQIWNSLNM